MYIYILKLVNLWWPHCFFPRIMIGMRVIISIVKKTQVSDIYIYIHYIHIIFTWKFLRRSLSLFPTWVGLAQRWRHSFLAWLRSPRTVTHQAMLGKIGMVTIFMLKKTPGVPQKSWSWAFSFGRCNISIFLRQRTIYIIIIVIIIIIYIYMIEYDS